MSLYVKVAVVFSAGLLATAAVAAEKSKDDKSKKPETKEASDKKSKDKSKDKESDKDKEKKKSKPPEDPNAPPKAIEVPMPNGRPALGLNIPYRDEQGKLQMRFIIGVAKKIDDTHIHMSELQVETFNDDGAHEMTMDLPTSILDLTTSVLTAEQPVKIQREDFELTGNTMIFNTRTKQGGLGGNVQMTIYNLDDETGQNPPVKPAAAPATAPK